MRSAFAAIFVAIALWVPPSGAADIMIVSGVVVAPGQSAGLAVSLGAPAPVGGVFISLSSSDTSRVTVSPANLYVPAGATASFSQPQVAGVNYGSATILATAQGLAGASQTVRVSGTLFGLSALTVQSGTTQNVTLTLASPTPTPLAIGIVSDNPAVAGVPASVVIPANGTGVVIPVTGLAAGSAVIRAGALPDILEHIVSVSVVAPATITPSGVASVPVNQSASYPITLGTAAGPGGVVVTLQSDNTFCVAISPSSVFVPAGATTPTTQPTVTGVNIGSANITASASGYPAATRQVVVTATITMSPETLYVPSGGSRLLSLILSGAAPSNVPITGDRGSNGFVNGLVVQLTSSNPGVASLQPTVQFYPDGSAITTVVVVVWGNAPGTAVIHASAPPYIADTIATIVVTSSGTNAASIAAVGGTPQTAAVNTPFGAPLAAIVKDASGNPVSGATVTFTAPAGGPTLSFAGGVNTAVTNASGIATSQTVTAGSTGGTYVVSASVAGVSGTAGFTLTNTSAAGGGITLSGAQQIGTNQSAALAVSLTSPAPIGGVSIALTSSDVSKVQVTPASVLVPAGATAPLSQVQVTGVNFGSAAITASSSGYTSASQTIVVGATLTFSPPSLTINGAVQQNISLSLSSPAPAGGLTVSLSSSNAAVATVPPSVALAANTTTVSVPVTGVSSGSTSLTASAGVPNVPNASATVTVSSGSAIVLGSGVTVAPGQSAGLAVSLSAPAPAGGVFISLSSGDTSKVTISPASLYVPAGATASSAQPQVAGVNYGTATIYATAQGLAGASQTVRVAGTLFGPSALTVQRGTTQNVTLILASPTPAPLAIGIVSDNPAVAGAPGIVIIPANGTAAVLPITGLAAGSAVIRAGALPDILEHAINISVVAPAAITLSGGATVPVGQSAPYPVALGTPAGPGGVVVALQSDNPFSVVISPSSVYVPAGATTPATQPAVTGVNIGSANITASAPGYLAATRQVVVTATITMSPQTLYVPSGGARLLSMILSAAAPSSVPITGDRGTNGFVDGLTVQMTSSNPGVASVQPSVQFYPDGSAITTVVVVVWGNAPGTAVIHASAPPYIPDTIATIVVQ